MPTIFTHSASQPGFIVFLKMSCPAQSSLDKCPKALDDIDGLRDRLMLLNSLGPDEQIAALAGAGNEVRRTILNKIEPVSRREIYRSIVAL